MTMQFADIFQTLSCLQRANDLFVKRGGFEERKC